MEGKIVVVTGGCSGIGKAVAVKFERLGAKVIAADISAQDTVLTEAAISPYKLDVTDSSAVSAMVSAIQKMHGRIDCLVQSAGIGHLAPFLDTPIEVFERVLAINLRGSFIVAQEVARAMAATGGGSIVNISSISGVVGNGDRVAYAASKGGVVQLTRVMATELAEMNIRVNAIAPGSIEAPMLSDMLPQRVREQFMGRVPLKRFGRAEEVANGVAFLCSDAASYVNGQILPIDGGFISAGIESAFN